MPGLALNNVMRRERLRRMVSSVHLQEEDWAVLAEVAHPHPYFGVEIGVEIPRGSGRDEHAVHGIPLSSVIHTTRRGASDKSWK